MRRNRTIARVLACMLLAACSNSAEKLTKELQDATSWIASARTVMAAYASDAVPQAYARDALETFSRQLQSTTERVERISDPRAPQIASTLHQAQQTMAQIDNAIVQGDRMSLAQFDVQLATEENTLQQLNSQQP